MDTLIMLNGSLNPIFLILTVSPISPLQRLILIIPKFLKTGQAVPQLVALL